MELKLPWKDSSEALLLKKLQLSSWPNRVRSKHAALFLNIFILKLPHIYSCENKDIIHRNCASFLHKKFIGFLGSDLLLCLENTGIKKAVQYEK